MTQYSFQVPCGQGTFSISQFTFSSVFAIIRVGHSIIALSRNTIPFDTLIFLFVFDKTTDGTSISYLGFDIIAVVFNKFTTSLNSFYFGKYKSSFGSNYIMGRHSNFQQT